MLFGGIIMGGVPKKRAALRALIPERTCKIRTVLRLDKRLSADEAADLMSEWAKLERDGASLVVLPPGAELHLIEVWSDQRIGSVVKIGGEVQHD
jgi:hypothetical protein